MGRQAGLVAAGFLLVCFASCSAAQRAVSIGELQRRILADFERSVKEGEEAYAALFDFAAVGKFEKLLHRYDLRGRTELTEEQRAMFEKEDATPYSVERERTNLGHYFYPVLAKRTVGTGNCTMTEPIDDYAVALGRPFEPLGPEDAHFEPLRLQVNQLIENGGIIGVKCAGGTGRLTIIYTRAANERGYDLITMYDDLGKVE